MRLSRNWMLGLFLLLLGTNLSIGNAIVADDPSLTDPEIKKAISKEFEVRPTIPSRSINIEVQNGIVTLKGVTDNLLEKERAKEVALEVRGVQEVRNHIKVRDVNRSDEDVRKDIEQALLLNAATDSYEVKADVADGVVTLFGNVDSWNEAVLTEEVAKSVKGVADIKNKIVFKYQKHRSDSEVAAGIRERLRFDTRVNDGLIDVKVNNGDVVLSGTVASAEEKEQAMFDAWIAGVKSVDITGLKVNANGNADDFKKGKYADRTDAELKNAINNALLIDPRVNSYNIKVQTNKGTVTLSGEPDNLNAKRAAEEIAKNIVGVDKVVNKITIDVHSMDDAMVKNNVERALVIDPVVDNYQINAKVSNGNLTLSGAVETYYEKFHAEDVAAGVKGVASIQNNLKVKDTYSVIYYQYMDPIVITPRKSDKEIKKDIESQLWWSPFVNASEVDVLVDGGEATLLGTVDSWNEEQSAIENAYEGGAVSVENRLLIDNS